MHIFSVKKIYLFCSLLNAWSYFWNKYCSLPFLAICRSQFASSWWQKVKIALGIRLQNKQNYYYFKGLDKTTRYKTKPIFSQFFFSHWLLYECLFFPGQNACKFWKIDQILLTSFHCIAKCRKFENIDRNISPKTYSF